MEDILKTSIDFTKRVQKWPETAEVLSRNNHIILFLFPEGDFLCFTVSNGKIKVKAQKPKQDFWKVLTFETSKKGAYDLLSGKTTIAQLIRKGDLQIEYAKRPLVSWFGQVIRLHREKMMQEYIEAK